MFILQIAGRGSVFGGFGGFGGGQQGFQPLGRGVVARPNPLNQFVGGALQGFSQGNKLANTIRQQRLDREIEKKQREFLETENPLFGLIKDPDEAIKILISERKSLAALTSKFGHDEKLENLKAENSRKLERLKLQGKGVVTREEQEFQLFADLALNAAKSNADLKKGQQQFQQQQVLGTEESNQRLIEVEEKLLKNEAIFAGFDSALDREAERRNISPAITEALKRSVRKGKLNKIDQDLLDLITGKAAGVSGTAQAIIDALEDEEEPVEEQLQSVEPGVEEPEGGGFFSRLAGFE